MATILFDDYGIDSQLYSDLKSNPLDYFDKESVTEDEVINYIHDVNRHEYRELMNQLDNINIPNNYGFYGYGLTGRWNGKYKAYTSQSFDTISECIVNISNECDHIKIYLDKRNLHVMCRHHDGTNEFIIKGIRLDMYERNTVHSYLGLTFYEWLINYCKSQTPYTFSLYKLVKKELFNE